MKKTLLLISVVLLALVFASCMRVAPGNSAGANVEFVWKQIQDAPYVEGRLIVGYSDIEALSEIVSLLDAEITIDIPRLNAAGLRFDSTVEEARGAIRELFVERPELVASIRYIEPNYERELIKPVKDDNLKLPELPVVLAEDTFPDLEGFLWGIKKVRAPQAWAAGYDGTGIIVAVLDTGIDSTHPDLQGQITHRYDPFLDLEIDPDIDYSFEAHGSHVAGTIAAKDDGSGVIGVAPGAKIMDIPIFQPNYIGDEFVAAGIVYAIENGATVLSNSWGGKGFSTLLYDAIAYASENYVVFVNSAGNEHVNEVKSPAMYPGVVVVAASTAGDGITHFSSRSVKLSVAAPGDFSILSTVPLWDVAEFAYPDLPYAYYGGTSMACPHVSGAIAILQQKYKDMGLTVYQYRKLIELGADDIMAPGKDNDSGYGRLNVEKSLSLDPDALGTGGNAVFWLQTKRTYYDEELEGEYPMGIPGVYVSMIPHDLNLPPIYIKSIGDLELAGAAAFDIDVGMYDVYFGSGDLFDPSSLLYFSGRVQEQEGKKWESYEVTHNPINYVWADVVEFSSSPKLVIEKISLFQEGTEIVDPEITLLQFIVTAINAFTGEEFSSTVSYDGGAFTLPDYAPAPQYMLTSEPFPGLEDFLADKTVVFTGYVEYDNDPDRRIYFQRALPAGIGFISDGWSIYFSAF
ncbi:MAG TPA: S8 family serine peptidase [Mesotoga sp.]|nr:S8 family serine peptidase [Mesotoga sp.]HPI16939.1 S8 family serine peptidase [Mesotoga sp.]HPM94179.1 S8 family serine peptidase [Mesotoga sp.]HQC57378.1 S8 family serine peptidase [Mesotoga sp.]HQQ55253.1 S8 family serine peptidase [Mesotoga sp.]